MQPSLQIVRILILFSLTLTNLFLISSATAAEFIGDITEQTGVASLIRTGGEEIIVSKVSTPGIELKDTAITGNGRILIEFLDEEELSIIEHTKIYIDKAYYDPDPSKSEMAIRMVQGTARFSSGRGKRINKSNINLSTPTAEIAILGTDFTTTIDEIGQSLIILLPDEETGKASGKIIISNAGGTVTLEEAYQASVISSYDTAPSRPVVLSGIDNNMISNIFIVSEPKEIKEVKAEEGILNENESDNILDVDFLEFNELETDYLAYDELEFSELDIDYLDVDFLQDILDIVLDLDKKTALDRSALSSEVALDGTKLGFDVDSQYNTLLDKGDGTVKFFRDVDGVISITMLLSQNATLRTITDQKESEIILGDGQGIIINITQVQ
tara:strand:+ start:4461 stop:5615 length:1155 start_codon:yes stop_codon:yes gene_type:complete